ncbi:MAG: 3-methyl-2-oxobutanoate hydroxymethyltransferase [Chloroflexota bacterium]|nr:3-methyl-2-oxobutanoate hydroxymethyltransferase [Chloroflexota bacterium]
MPEQQPAGAYGGGPAIPAKKVTVPEIVQMKRDGRKIAMMTAYDVAFARLVDQAGMDIILVGDSLGMVMLGYPTTVPVTMDDMVRHAAAVSRGAKRALLVGDMPFGSYQTGRDDAIRNATRFLKEAGMDAVKLEGGHEVVETTRALVESGVAVMGHVGLTPQRVAQFGGFKVQAKSAEAARVLIDDCVALEQAGCFSIVIESVPAAVAVLATERVRIPTIGIGGGVGCDGQVLVLHDALGLFGEFKPKFAKRYADLGPIVVEALERYGREVRDGVFPDDEHSFSMKEGERAELERALSEPRRPKKVV